MPLNPSVITFLAALLDMNRAQLTGYSLESVQEFETVNVVNASIGVD